MFKPDKRLQRWFEKFNKLYFDSSLANVIVGWDDELKEDKEGLTISLEETQETKYLSFTVHLSVSLKGGSRNAVLLTLLHELCHVKLYPYMKHGRRFQEEMKRLAMRDAFKEIW